MGTHRSLWAYADTIIVIAVNRECSVGEKLHVFCTLHYYRETFTPVFPMAPKL